MATDDTLLPDQATETGNGAALDGDGVSGQGGQQGPAGGAPSAASLKVRLHNRFEIDAESPLPDLDSHTASAYAARGREEAGRSLFSLVLDPLRPNRLDVMGSLRGIDQVSILRMIEFGVVPWGRDETERLVVIFEQPNGPRLARTINDRREPMSEDQIARKILVPMVAAMRELRVRRVFHGSINPTNLFMNDGGGVQLGECVSCLPGAMQPTVFEPLERGMAMPSGRGTGVLEDDLYALGVTCVFLALGYNPVAHLSDEEITLQKMEKGTFQLLAGDVKLPAALIEPVRGLLIDDSGQRWSLDDLDLWASGRRLSPKQAQPPKRAVRPIDFSGGQHWTARSLAHAMRKQTAEANGVIESGGLEHWLNRSLDDEATLKRVLEAMRTAGMGRGGSIEERRVARVIMALDPKGPVRYKGVAVMPDGLGGALAEALGTGRSTQELAEIVSAQLPMFWVNVQSTFRPEFVPLAKKFDQMRGYLENTGIGFGIERCLYELNQSLPCQSSILQGHYVTELDALLTALESMAEKGKHGSGQQGAGPQEPVDRHVMAFMLSRHGGLDDRLVQKLNRDREDPARRIAILDIFLELQKQARIKSVPNLCVWLAALIEPAVALYHSRTLRTRMTEELAAQAKTGMVRNLYSLIHNGDLARRDAAGFDMARREFEYTNRGIAQRRKDIQDSPAVNGELGRQIAAVAAGVMSMVLLVGIILVQAV
ncbi:serine/threonine protein kinase [Fodinicurvata sp. EGI_FJ10296]|uniref:serine/threonine protein kinase n=1 Tax=Fodinicurvata sp. EGI_FJ10296 TaxID=3231908 RepID=UPI003456058C